MRQLVNIFIQIILNLEFNFKMGGKKKGGDGKKKAKAAVDENDTQVPDFWKLYKKKVVEYDVEISKPIKV